MMSTPPRPGAHEPASQTARLFNRLIEPPPATPERWRGRLRVLSGVLLPLNAVALVVGIVLGVRFVTGALVNQASLLTTLSSLAVLGMAYGLARTGRYLPAAGLTMTVVLLSITIPIIFDPSELIEQVDTLLWLIVPVILGGLLMTPRFAAGHAVVVLGLAGTLYSTLTDHSPWEVFYTLLLLAIVSFLVVIGAAIHDRDSARIEAQGKSLAESSQRFSTAFDLAPDGMALVAIDGRFIQVNQALSGLVEYDDAALLTMNLADLIVPEERNLDSDQRAALLADEVRSYQIERQLMSRSGDLVWVILSTSLVRDFSARPAYFITHIKEIQARKAAEAALNESNIRLTQWLSEMEQRTAEMAILNELGELLQACTNIDEALQIVAGSAQQLFPGGSGGLCVQGTSRASLVTVAEWGNGEVRERVFTQVDCWALRRGRAHLSPSGDNVRRCRHLAETGATHLCLPLIAQGEPLGLLHLGQINGDEILGSQRRLAQTVADNAALALANLRLLETLRNQSIRDTLTGLYNRRYLDETLERELHRARRNNRGLGILMLDIDHFKAFNDSHGHAAGDAVLSGLGEYLRRNLRASDIACRMGGEEFALIMLDAELDAVRERAEEIHGGLQDLNVEYDGKTLGPISISVGIAVYPVHGETPEELLQAADSAMYQAKRAGRDRVAEYAAPV